jgi:hypothetical protein
VTPIRFAYVLHFSFFVSSKKRFSNGINATINHVIAKEKICKLEADMFDIEIPT